MFNSMKRLGGSYRSFANKLKASKMVHISVVPYKLVIKTFCSEQNLEVQ